MTASLPSDVQAVFARFVTTELTTVDGKGQPITWPVTPFYRLGAPCIDVTAELRHPKKADDARANPLVALLFSDPTDSGLDKPPMVLVQGSAQVDDRDLRANRERYDRELREKLGAGDSESRERIYIHVRPERIYVWPEADIGDEPQLYDAHMEEVRSGHSEEPDRYHAAPVGGASTWSPRMADLGTRHPTAVLSLISPDGFPFAVRVPVHVDAAARWIVIDGAPVGIPFQPGLACLTAADFQVRGDLVWVDDAWALIPHEVAEELEAHHSRIASLLGRLAGGP